MEIFSLLNISLTINILSIFFASQHITIIIIWSSSIHHQIHAQNLSLSMDQASSSKKQNDFFFSLRSQIICRLLLLLHLTVWILFNLHKSWILGGIYKAEIWFSWFSSYSELKTSTCFKNISNNNKYDKLWILF